MKEFELNAKELSLYIRKFYIERYEGNKNHRDISPIKLQKSLYFLFAYWGQYIRLAKQNTNSVEFFNANEFSENLFDYEIQAWTYGPVIPKVYYLQRETFGTDKNLPEGYLEENEHNLVIKEFIDYLLPQLFDISDFGLVDLSHQDDCWKKHYHENEEQHHQIIPKDEIIDEYCSKKA